MNKIFNFIKTTFANIWHYFFPVSKTLNNINIGGETTMSNVTEGGDIDQLKIDPNTGKTTFDSSTKTSGVNIGTTTTTTNTPSPPSAADITPTTIVVQGTPGRGIQSAAIISNHLILTFTDGSTIDAGVVQGATIPSSNIALSHATDSQSAINTLNSVVNILVELGLASS